ncbi:MAG: urease accessory UreF family protein [Verrucomicrobiales bacterium]|nr:urease accessory UreF family protein [Verrucomicrobiales bacterium]
MSDTFHAAFASDAELSNFDGADLAHVVALLGIAPETRATFSLQEESRLAPAWDLWQENWFSPALVPAFAGCYHAASRLKIDDIQRIDETLDAKLNDSIRERSINAGKAFLDGKSEMKGHREWIRFTERIAAGKCPGHLPVLFALQCQLFHLPLAPSLTTYARFEFQSRDGKFPFKKMSVEEGVIFSTILPSISLAVQENREDHSDGSVTLRVI